MFVLEVTYMVFRLKSQWTRAPMINKR